MNYLTSRGGKTMKTKKEIKESISELEEELKQIDSNGQTGSEDWLLVVDRIDTLQWVLR